MKLTKMKKIISGTVSALMIATSVPFSSSAAEVNLDLGSVTGSNVGGGFGDWGGMNWGGNNGGNIDWGGMAGGFNDNNSNIGSDAGNGGNAQSGLNAKIKNDMPTTVPSGNEKSNACKVEKKTYNCKFTGGQKSCNVVLPPNYDSSKQYPVMYVLHGIGGDENSMVSGMGVQELLAGLIANGKAEEMIIVLPSQYTSKNGSQGGGFGINQETCAAYDNFLYDISDSLIPYIEANYPVKTGRENRAITGFSMGGREAIYIGLMRPDLFAYVGGACPAPGITPGKDMFMEHPGCMQESEMKFRDVGPEPYVFMITGGTNDSVVGTFPKSYSDILTRNGVEHVYQSIPGGGHGADSVKPHLYTFMRYAFKAEESSVVTTTTTTTATTTTTTSATTTTTTTVATTLATTPATTTTVDIKADIDAKVKKWGDANNDNTVDMGDVVLIMQALANPNKYKLDEPGIYNADVSEAGGGITSNDALVIQKYLLGIITKLPESYAENTDVTPVTQPTTTTVTTAKTTTTTSAPEEITTTTTAAPVASGSVKADFDSSIGDWTGRGAASVAAASDACYGSTGKALAVTGRSAEWNGAAIELGSDFKVGETYSVSLAALQISGRDATIQVSLQQGEGDSASYTSIAKESCKSGEWTKIENTSFTIPDNAGDMILYVETIQDSGDLMDFYIDDVLVAAEGTKSSVVTGGEGMVPDPPTYTPGTVDSSKKLCAISFDDGASAQTTSDPGYRIINALAKNNMTATFFNVGSWIKTNEQIKYEFEKGMEVANHTQTHPHLGQLGSQQVRSEWEQCNSKLKSIIGTEPSHLMRLPYLESNATVQSALNDVPLISCAIDTQDWNGASKDAIVNTIKQAAQNGSLEGAIVLCHENYATTAAAMEEVLPWLAQNGYQNVNISDMATAHGKTLAGGQVHTRA